MMKVAFIAHLSEISGAGVALVDTVAGLSSVFETWLIVPGDGPLLTRAAQRGIRTVVIPNPEIAMLNSALAQKARVVSARARYIRRLRHFLRTNRIDLAYVNSSASIFAGMAARMAGVPIAWHIHETLDISSGRTRLKKQAISKLADGLIYASHSAMKHLPPPAGTPAMVALNYVPIAALKEVAAHKKTAGEQTPLILLNGTFHRKGADILLQAIKELAKQAEAVRPQVEITGKSNPSDTFYFDLTQTAGDPLLDGRVTFSGYQPSLIEPLKRATVFVSASRNEALPISIVEAMAAGLPVIATDVGDCADLLSYGKCGWVVPPESPAALAAALHEVLTEPDLVDAKTRHASEKVSSLYHAENFWAPVESFINTLIQRSS